MWKVSVENDQNSTVHTLYDEEQDVIQIVEDEVINIEAKNFDFALFVDYIRGVLFSTLFEHKVEADNWVH